jgi:guanyl-specific ribonuclease Sa
MRNTRERFGTSRPPQSAMPRMVRLVMGLGLVLCLMYVAWEKSKERPAPQQPAGPPPVVIQPPETETDRSDFDPVDAKPNSPAEKLPRVKLEPERVVKTQIKNAKIRDQDGDVVFSGTVDLRDTLDRIERGQRGSHGNDGSVFQNREKRLPRKPSGYYREWVHPTPDMRGPGPQRIVTGEDGEIYYTPDHYKTFERLDSESGAGREGRGARE